MKKAIIIFLISALFSDFASAQNLLDVYKKGPVKLTPEKSYGAKNNWESLFNLYYDTLTKDVGREEFKKIVVAPDGSVFMSHKNRWEIWKFGQDGNFVKSFGVKGGKAYQFPYLPSVEPIVDGKYVFTTDANGRLKFFDLEGNYFKSITLKYMTRSFQPTSDGEILFEGNVMWKKTDSKYVTYNWRHIIVSLNLYSGAEKIIYSFFENSDYKILNTTNPDSILFMLPVDSPEKKLYLPNSSNFKRPVFTLLKDGRFILSNRENGEVKVFDKSGQEKFSLKLDITPIQITEKNVLENYQNSKQQVIKAIDQIKSSTTISESRKLVMTNQNEKFLSTLLDKYKAIGNYYSHLPYFSNIILDDEGNLLVFEFTSKDDALSNIFNVIAYDSNGNKLARTSFICNDYDLSFSESTFVISKGYVYAVAKLKNTTGMPLRLVKFKISN